MKVNRKTLIGILAAVKPAVDGKDRVEQSNSFIFFKNRVYTYNDEIAVSHPVDLDLECSIQAKEFSALLEKLADDDIDIEVSNSHLLVNGKKAKAGVTLQMDVNKDILASIGDPTDWKDLPEDFVVGVSFCMFSVGRDLNKPMLTCIHATGDRVYSTDSYRITAYKLGAEVPYDMNIPASAAKELKTFSPAAVAQTPGWLHFQTKDDVIFSTRIMEGSYPAEKAQQFIDSVGDADIIKLPTNMSETLTRAGIFSSAQGAAVERVSIDLKDGELIIAGKGEGGWFEESSRIRYTGEPVHFEVSHSLLNDILKHTDEVVIGERMLKFEGQDFVHVITILS